MLALHPPEREVQVLQPARRAGELIDARARAARALRGAARPRHALLHRARGTLGLAAQLVVDRLDLRDRAARARREPLHLVRECPQRTARRAVHRGLYRDVQRQHLGQFTDILDQRAHRAQLARDVLERPHALCAFLDAGMHRVEFVQRLTERVPGLLRAASALARRLAHLRRFDAQPIERRRHHACGLTGGLGLLRVPRHRLAQAHGDIADELAAAHQLQALLRALAQLLAQPIQPGPRNPDHGARAAVAVCAQSRIAVGDAVDVRCELVELARQIVTRALVFAHRIGGALRLVRGSSRARGTLGQPQQQRRE